MIAPMTFFEEQLARKFFELGAIKIDIIRGFKLKLHEKNPDAPVSPLFLNLRTPDNPKPGPLTKQMVGIIGNYFYSRAYMFYLRFDCVAGIPRAGDPFAEAFSDASSSSCHGCYTRIPLIKLEKVKSKKGRKVNKVLSGKVSRKTVLLIDDLITKAHSKLEAIRALELAGAKVRDVLIVVDREQGGSKQLEEAGYNIHSIFTISQLIEFYFKEGMISENQYGAIQYYIRANR